MSNSKPYKEVKFIKQIKAKLDTRKNSLSVEEEIDADYYSASVLIPIVYQPSGYSILFTKRTKFVNRHKGQISFPGGMIERGDEDL